MSSHTPGPWKVDSAPHGDRRIYAPSEVHPIAMTNKWDARLIAAAPELLAALHEMYHAFLDPDHIVTDRQEAASLGAYRAIYKATGKTT